LKKQNIFTVVLAFLKVGAIGFGGGAALIPVIERELVENKRWMDKERFDLSVVISSISPASLPVSLCSMWHSRYSLISAYCYALPGPLIYLALLTGFSFIGGGGAQVIRYASIGIISYVLVLLYGFVRKNYIHGVKDGGSARFIFIAAAAFALNCGGAVTRFAETMFPSLQGSLPTPVFSLNMAAILLTAFFIIGVIGGSASKIRICAAFVVAGLYSLSIGARGLLGFISVPLMITMVIMAAVSIIYDIITAKPEPGRKPFSLDLKPLRNLSFFVIIALGLTFAVYAVSGDANAWWFASRVFASALTSFGGGEAYIGVADAFFVQSGFVTEEMFNTRILGISSAMPGPVLVSMAAGIGFLYGGDAGGMGNAWMFGALGWSVSVTATAFGALLLYTFFDMFKDSERLRMVKRYMMPVVCGILVCVALTLVRQTSAVLIGAGLNPFASLAVVVGLFGVMLFIRRQTEQV
jgi:chromate transporter